MSIIRHGSIGGRMAEPVREKEEESYGKADEIQMCLNCEKNKKGRGCDEKRFRKCVREMRKRKDK